MGDPKVLPITDVKSRAELFAALRSRVEQVGFTEIANQTGITRTHLYRIFSPEGNPSVETLMRLAEALGLRINLTLEK